MFELDQEVVVITDKGIAYEGFILARAKGDDGSGAYEIGLEGRGFEQSGQWHKACDVFVEERTEMEAQDSPDILRER